MPQVNNKQETSRTGVRPTAPSTTVPEVAENLIDSDAEVESDYGEDTHYSLLRVHEDATPEELKLAFRTLALANHPDKGGDSNTFHDLQMAYNVLEDKDKREAYDASLRAERERQAFVEGAPKWERQKINVPSRVKTAPTPGSKRSKKVEGQGGGEWKKLGSGLGQLKMIEDGVTATQKAEVLFSKFKDLPRNAERKREWLGGVRCEEKIALKAVAKAHEEAQAAKLNKWLTTGPAKRGREVGKKLVNRANPVKAAPKKEPLGVPLESHETPVPEVLAPEMAEPVMIAAC